MNTNIRNHRLKIIAALTLAVSTLIYAVATFLPETQPPVRLGNYALKNNDLLLGDTKAYRPWFENGAWQGDLIEYDVKGYCTSCSPGPGTRTTTAPVGETDNAALLSYANLVAGDTTKNWMARATFLLKENTDSSYWQNRKIITNNNGQVDFLWNNLSASQKLSLDPITINDPNGDGDTSDAITDLTVNQTPDDFSPILNFLRGDRSLERDKPGGFLRRRYNLLGDITTTPVYITPPRELLVGLNGFTNFSSKMDPFSATPCTGYSTSGLKQGCRPGRIATPANDGMLHIFNEDDGSEVYAYIPSMVIDKLDGLAARDATYKHTYYLDGELFSGSAQVNPDYSACSNAGPVFTGCNWRTILAGGGGPGFAGLFALDVTDPTSAGNKILFEKTVDDNGDGIGHIYGQPRIAPLGTQAQPQWYIFTGNGYSNASGHQAKLLMVSLDGSNAVTAIGTESGTRGLSSPVLLSTDGDVIADIAFAGDINGDMWMFKINHSNLASSTAHKIFDGSIDQPISNTPALAEYPLQSGNYFLYFGTGSIFSELDSLDDTSAQAVYGIHIKKAWIDGTESITPITSSDLVAQSMEDVNDPFVPTGANPDVIRVMENDNPVDLASVKGWKTALHNCGERLVGAPFLRSERLQFVTNNPTGLTCTGTNRQLVGDSWMMSLDYLTGGDADNVVYNMSGDSKLDDADKVPPGSSGLPPVGVHLGKGNISQPTLARLSSGIDKMYINGLILQVPLLPRPGAILSGHIDVQTDSPYSGVRAANDEFMLSEGYQTPQSGDTPLPGDGLGKTIDGHVHDYDSIHLVDYVDMFELEPRRGLPNPSPSEPGVAVVAELNRAYDTVIPVPEGEPPTCPEGTTEILDESGALIGCTKTAESEVYEPSGKLNPGQKFIVVLTNADLSFSGTLQIGCRTWPVLDFQEATTTALENADITSGDPLPSYFTDLDSEGRDLIFSLNEITGDTGCPAETTDTRSKGVSTTPTLRVGFGDRAILDGGIHGTRAQCVLGLHDPRDKACYSDEEVLSNAEAALDGIRDDDPWLYGATSHGGTGDDCQQFNGIDITEVPDYIRDPSRNLHVTPVPSEEGTGYRWRNGALTVQLLAVNNDHTAAFSLQDKANLPVKGRKRFGGTFAQAFTVVTEGSGAKAVDIVETRKELNESGMLYEASMFWHYSHLNDGLRNLDPDSSSTPQDTPCYGGDAYKGALAKESGGLTLGEYQFLTDPLLDECENFQPPDEDPEAVCDLERFAQLLAEIDSLEGDELEAALLEMAQLIAGNELLETYASYRDYAPGHVPEQHLLPWDVNQSDTDADQSDLDATPAKVISIETIDLETKGLPIFGSSIIWTDIKQ